MIIFPLIIRAIRNLLCNDAPPPPAKPFPTEAEIDAELARLASARGVLNLNWRESIVDLLVLLEVKNDMHTRALLYADLGAGDEYGGSAAQNMWMIQQVRHRFAEGQID